MVDLRTPELEFSPAALAAVLFDVLHIPRDTRFFVAFSGGIDSTALTHAFSVLRRERGLHVAAIHINHQLQPHADAWAAHAAQACAAWGMPCTVTQVRVAPDASGPEAAARAARYAALAAPLRAGDVVLTAHQRDDQAETLLYRLVRGTGVDGLAGMRSRRALGAGELVRPLLAFSRAALAAYVQTHNLSYVTDTSNNDARFSRNYLRAEIFPRLHARWPHANRALARYAEQAAATAELTDALARLDAADAIGDGALALAPLRPLTPVRRANVVRFWLRNAGFAAPSAAHLHTLVAWIDLSPMRNAILRWPGAEVRRYRDGIYVMQPLATIASDLHWPWQPSQPLNLAPLPCRLSLTQARGAGIATRFGAQAWHVRLRQGGERCRPTPTGATRELKNLFQEAGIPPWRRARMPLIFIDEDLAAVGAHWVCAPFAARADEAGLVPQCDWRDA